MLYEVITPVSIDKNCKTLLKDMLNLLMIQTDLPQGVEAAVTEPEGISTKFIDLALKGGWIMIPILVLSVVAVYIFFDRYFAIKKAGKFDSGLLDKIKVRNNFV